VFIPTTQVQRDAATARHAASAMTQQEKRQSFKLGAGVMIGVIIGSVIENLTMGIGIGIAIGLALSLVNTGGRSK
jgi:F0F1-type ATP synthase assembly protein I